MAAPKGNQNAKKGKLIEDLLRKISVQEDHKRIAKGLSEILNKAADGDQRAIEFVRDTFDGKPMQSVNMDATVDGNLTVEIVRYGKDTVTK